MIERSTFNEAEWNAARDIGSAAMIKLLDGKFDRLRDSAKPNFVDIVGLALRTTMLVARGQQGVELSEQTFSPTDEALIAFMGEVVLDARWFNANQGERP